MDTAEFDRFADEYRNLHLANVFISAGPVFRSARALQTKLVLAETFMPNDAAG